ncbi:hypothetical protein [Lysobacter gummosus]
MSPHDADHHDHVVVLLALRWPPGSYKAASARAKSQAEALTPRRLQRS